MDPDKLTAPERALWQAFPRGASVDLARARGVRARTVRAEVIAALLLGAVPPEHGRTAAIRLDGGRITGMLGLEHAVITGPVRLRHCEFETAIDLSGAKTRDIDLEGSKFTGLLAPLAQVDGNLSLTGCDCTGEVVLTGGRITGALQLQKARLNYPGNAALLGNRLVVDGDLLAQQAVIDGGLWLDAAKIGGTVSLDGATLRHEGNVAFNGANLSVGAALQARFGFSAAGEVLLADASTGGQVDFEGASLSNPGGNALLATGLNAGADIRLAPGFAARGAIRLTRARAGAEIRMDGVRVSNPGGNAIRCRYAQASALVLDKTPRVEGVVDLCHSRFTSIRDDPACWPERLRISGLSYDVLDPPLPATHRVRWLRRDADGYQPQNYETLAAMYRTMGDDAGARVVLLGGERERRAQLPRYARAWSWLQEVTVGYGYRPLRAAAWLTVLLALGTLVFGLHHPPPFQAAPHPAFNPFIYTVDLLVPLVSLGMRNSYDPQGPQRWLAYFFIAAGWIFVTTIAAGILRVLRRQ